MELKTYFNFIPHQHPACFNSRWPDESKLTPIDLAPGMNLKMLRNPPGPTENLPEPFGLELHGTTHILDLECTPDPSPIPWHELNPGRPEVDLGETLRIKKLVGVQILVAGPIRGGDRHHLNGPRTFTPGRVGKVEPEHPSETLKPPFHSRNHQVLDRKAYLRLFRYNLVFDASFIWCHVMRIVSCPWRFFEPKLK